MYRRKPVPVYYIANVALEPPQYRSKKEKREDRDLKMN